MYVPEFAELAGDEERFFDIFFGKQPLYRQAALSQDPRALLSIDELDRMMRFEAIRPPYFGVLQAGEALPSSAYTTTTRVQGTCVHDVVRPEKVHELFDAGATLSWSAINHYHLGIRELAAALTAKFAVECRATALLTPPGGAGFSPHHDPVDIFVLQLEGTKHWSVWNPPAARRGLIEHYHAGELGEPVIDVMLRPGDVLYLPYDTPHLVLSQDDVSLHLSVLVKPRMWRDLLRLTVDRLLDSEEFWQFPYLNESQLDVASGMLADRVSLLVKHLQQLDVAAELRRLALLGLENGESPPRRTLLSRPGHDRVAERGATVDH